MLWLNPPEDPEDWYGFTYLITNILTGQKYIGRKYFHSYSKGKRLKQSNWKTYTSSSKDVNADIKLLGIDKFTFEILGLYKTRQEVNYAEVERQIFDDVLRSQDKEGNFLYYNTNIMTRFFRPKEYGTQAYFEKQQQQAQLKKEKYLANKSRGGDTRRSSRSQSKPKPRASKVSTGSGS